MFMTPDENCFFSLLIHYSSPFHVYHNVGEGERSSFANYKLWKVIKTLRISLFIHKWGAVIMSTRHDGFLSVEIGPYRKRMAHTNEVIKEDLMSNQFTEV